MVRGSLLLLVGVMASACGAAEERMLACNDLLAPKEAGFERVAALVMTRGGKGCSSCHNTEAPVRGLNFEGPAVAYDALVHKMHLVYPQVEAGLMPEDGAPWDEDDLRLLRSWYCHGAFYEKP